MRSVWKRVQSWPIWLRWPSKWLVFVLVVFLVLYPKPSLFLRNVRHVRQLNDLPDITEPTVGPVAERFDRFLAEAGVSPTHPQAMLEATERFVLQEIPYGWDWDVWGVVDYVPTVAEVIARGTEDCDGRAVLAATLLRVKGIDAQLVGDPRHMWVSTPIGDTMNPLGPPVFQANKTGTHIQWRRMLDPGPFAFGTSVFPFGREAIILLTGWLLLLPPAFSTRRAAFALFLLVEGLVILRLAGADPMKPNYSGMIWAAAHACVAVGILCSAGRRTRRHPQRM